MNTKSKGIKISDFFHKRYDLKLTNLNIKIRIQVGKLVHMNIQMPFFVVCF